MIRALIFSILLFALAGAVYADDPQQVIDVQHDAHRQVTCWIIPGTGISCLPDSQLRLPAPVPNHVRERTNPASAPTPRQHAEVFEL
jgi:hypothetical protein